ncbi:DUF4407 domain-containing protein [Nonomuraea sp. NPDC003804]|uniref:DUF4407 domain-containing protein n=1 Tax=Nonomuraea sp. NPDC003804 TaxID=3154547 RepID=UPI0033AB6367
MNESILDWVPEDRPTLTRTGAIILSTALMAAASLWIVVHEVFGASMPASVAAAAIWGTVICVFDSWLVTSTHGVTGRDRVARLLPRLAISVLIGVVISEPLTLKAFESAVIEQVAEDRRLADQELRAGFKRCYPGWDQQPPTGCDDFKLDVPRADTRTLEATIAQRDQRQKEVARLKKLETSQAALEGKECLGTGAGQGFTGRPGNGYWCGRRRAATDTTRQALQTKEQELQKLEQTVTQLTNDRATAAATYEQAVSTGIAAEISRRSAARSRQPGLLEQFRALSSLTAANWAVFWAHLVLAGLLIVIDCFPVLTKLISKPSAYDRRLAAQRESKERLHDNDLRLNERLRTGDGEIRLHKEELRVRHAIEDSDHEVRLSAARREAELRARMDQLAKQAKQARVTGQWPA